MNPIPTKFKKAELLFGNKKLNLTMKQYQSKCLKETQERTTQERTTQERTPWRQKTKRANTTLIGTVGCVSHCMLLLLILLLPPPPKMNPKKLLTVLRKKTTKAILPYQWKHKMH